MADLVCEVDIHSLPCVCTKQTAAYPNYAMGYYSMYILLLYHSLPGLHEKRPVIMLAVTLLKAIGIPLICTGVHVASNTSLLIDQVVDLGWDLQGPAPAP